MPDIKPDNILVDCQHTGDVTQIQRVQIIDLENVGYTSWPRYIKGTLLGNDNWRSPEGHLRGVLTQPTDIFSFGAVVSKPQTIFLRDISPLIRLTVHLRYARQNNLWP